MLKQKSEKKEAPVEVSNPNAAAQLGGAKYKHNSFILQKYIERPLLIS